MRPTEASFALHLAPSGCAAVAELAAVLLAGVGRPSTVDRQIAVLCSVCAAVRQAEGAAEQLAVRYGSESIAGQRSGAVRDAALAHLPTADARWAVVWALLCSLHTAGLHDATASMFAHALAEALDVPLARVIAAEDALAAELGLLSPAASRGGPAASALACQQPGADADAALLVSDAAGVASSLDRRWALTLSALGGGAALAVGGPLSGAALAGAIGSRTAFLLGAAAASTAAHCALEADAWLLPAERRGGCQHGGAELRRGLHLTVYCGPPFAAADSSREGAAGGDRSAPGGVWAGAPRPAEGSEPAQAEAERAAARAVWRAPIASCRWGEHRVLLWEASRALQPLLPLLQGRGGSLGAPTDALSAAPLWRQSGARAEWCGAALARQLLVRRAAGSRPISLVGASHGALVVLAALSELAASGAHGIVHSVCLLGAPVSLSDPRWAGALAVVLGRFVNVHCRDDRALLALGAAGGTFRHASGPVRFFSGRAPAHAARRALGPELLAGVHGTRALADAGRALGLAPLEEAAGEGATVEDVEVTLGPGGHAAYASSEHLAACLRAAHFPPQS